MSYSKTVFNSLLLVGMYFLVSCTQQSPPTAGSSSPSEPPVAETYNASPGADEAAPPAATHAHSDHDSKHGGTFFMALDNKHHLEGVLLPPGVLRVYLYDEYTRPLSRAGLEQTQGEVIWGDVDGALKIPLNLSQDGATLDATPQERVRFPVTLTLLLHLPGSLPNQRPELFTFPFSHYSNLQPGGH